MGGGGNTLTADATLTAKEARKLSDPARFLLPGARFDDTHRKTVPEGRADAAAPLPDAPETGRLGPASAR